jgi:solute carrier family 25 (mitochondrial folate transporter), member 32
MPSTSVGAYKSIADGMRQIYRNEGLPGFYRGFVPSLFGVMHGAIQLMTYEQLKQLRADGDSGQRKKLTNMDYFLCSGLSKAVAGSITYPHQVVRSRLQVQDAKETYKNARDVLVQVWRHEGLAGFYKGLGPNLLRVVPSSCVTFLVYENTKANFSTPRTDRGR